MIIDNHNPIKKYAIATVKVFVDIGIMCECICECLLYKLRNTAERGRKMFIVKKKEFVVVVVSRIRSANIFRT